MLQAMPTHHALQRLPEARRLVLELVKLFFLVVLLILILEQFVFSGWFCTHS